MVYQTIRSNRDDNNNPEYLRPILPDNLVRLPEIAEFRSVEGVENMCDADILLVNDALLSCVDHVIFCTGYRFSLPFLPGYQAQACPGGNSADQQFIINDGTRLHNLHKDMFFIPDPTLAFIGVSFEIATFSFFDIQAIAVEAVFSGRATLPDRQQMYEEYERKKRECGTSKRFHVLGQEKELSYIQEIVTWVNASSDRPHVSGYEKTVLETKERQVEVFRELLKTTVVLRGKTKEETEHIINEKVKVLELELAKSRTVGGRMRAGSLPLKSL
jgi:hypothetical protein